MSKMMRYIENPGIAKTVYSDIFRLFRDIQQYSAMFKDTEGN